MLLAQVLHSKQEAFAAGHVSTILAGISYTQPCQKSMPCPASLCCCQPPRGAAPCCYLLHMLLPGGSERCPSVHATGPSVAYKPARNFTARPCCHHWHIQPLQCVNTAPGCPCRTPSHLARQPHGAGTHRHLCGHAGVDDGCTLMRSKDAQGVVAEVCHTDKAAAAETRQTLQRKLPCVPKVHVIPATVKSMKRYCAAVPDMLCGRGIRRPSHAARPDAAA